MKALLFILLVALVACQSSTVDKKGNEIKYKETVQINDVPKATLTFFDVSDSRCPENVKCVWAGNAKVDLALEGVGTEGKITKHINLCLGACSTSRGFHTIDSLDQDFAGQKYRFILESVNPYPIAAKTKNDYSISLRIEKK
ncbi:hypothetical protein [Dyadobacter sp. CY312]|uniref:hypothetical protein n=1 Tax=Dyadobacter sp. CY312 TaxID=2907303 RepID=UPI001F45559D|nr:hypothetical protein [Dyadobacter sp. CY312]MCE7039954.1 hypothetical protein [Dyadobacter sp. CY312]